MDAANNTETKPMTTSSLYTTSPDGRIVCADCRRWIHADAGGTVRHSSRCDHAADRTYHDPARLVVALPSDRSTATATPTLKQIHAAAKDGTLRAVLSDDEILDAVRAGIVSESDAMNQDF